MGASAGLVVALAVGVAFCSCVSLVRLLYGSRTASTYYIGIGLEFDRHHTDYINYSYQLIRFPLVQLMA